VPVAPFACWLRPSGLPDQEACRAGGCWTRKRAQRNLRRPTLFYVVRGLDTTSHQNQERDPQP
jgi:hypothetical protein